MNRWGTCALLTAALVVLAGAAPVPEPRKFTPDELKKAEAAVRKDLEDRKGTAAQVALLEDKAVEAMLPGHAYFAVLFRQYPVGRPTPPGLSAANVFAVDRDDKVTALPDAEKLFAFVQAHLAPVKGDADAKEAARAYLLLLEQLHQDGFYKFALMDDSTKVQPAEKGRKATARAVVMQGGNGTIDVELTFDDAGKLEKARPILDLKPGPRPICQATKLLDADPLVRRICERDLIIMGPACLDYLAEQHARAGPELRREIERVRQRIERGER